MLHRRVEPSGDDSRKSRVQIPSGPPFYKIKIKYIKIQLCDRMTRIITVTGAKGGTGKTTTVTNLALSLIKKRQKVIILDANVTTPNLSLHLGIPFYPMTLHDVLKKKITIDEAVYNHRSGIKVVPASLAVDAMEGVEFSRFESAVLSLLGQTDVIILDAAAGLGREAKAAIGVSDEIIIVTNPELPAVTDALKTIKVAEELGTKVLGVVINKVNGHKHEMSRKEVEYMLEVPILVEVPHDLSIPQSIYEKTPVVDLKPRCKSSLQFKKLASTIIGEQIEEPQRNESWVKRFFGWLV